MRGTQVRRRGLHDLSLLLRSLSLPFSLSLSLPPSLFLSLSPSLPPSLHPSRPPVLPPSLPPALPPPSYNPSLSHTTTRTHAPVRSHLRAHTRGCYPRCRARYPFLTIRRGTRVRPAPAARLGISRARDAQAARCAGAGGRCSARSKD